MVEKEPLYLILCKIKVPLGSQTKGTFRGKYKIDILQRS